MNFDNNRNEDREHRKMSSLAADNNDNNNNKQNVDIHAPQMQQEEIMQTENYPRIRIGGILLSFPSYIRYPTTEEYVTSRPYRCEYPGCGYRAKYRCWLVRHYPTHCTAKPFVCPRPFCSRRYKRKCEMRKHVRDVHLCNNNGSN